MRRLALVLSAAVVLTLGVRVMTGSLGPSTPETAPERPAVGQPAPRFELKDQDGGSVAIGGPSTGWTVVSFYGKAATPW